MRTPLPLPTADVIYGSPLSHIPALLPGEPTGDLVLGRSDRGRPAVVGIPAGRAGLDLNVSHHGPLVVLAAVAQECGGEDNYPSAGEGRKSLAFVAEIVLLILVGVFCLQELCRTPLFSAV